MAGIAKARTMMIDAVILDLNIAVSFVDFL
jgi:hypothetical protein